MDGLKSAIQKELSTGVIRGASYGEIAKRIEKRMVGDYKKFNGGTYAKAARIARTEGHRVQNTAAYDAQKAAQSKGANIVKQWDATLDARTRDSHAKVDGELTAVDEKFSNGLMFPGDPHGAAAEVCNCRCALLQRAKWALDADELERLKQRAEYYGLDKADSFEVFRKKYLKALDESDIINSGGYSGAKKTDGWQERHAERMYEEKRHRSTDVQKISESTPFTEDAVQMIKNHMFFDKHPFSDGTVRQFDPDFDQAQAWDRLSKGEGTETDILLLKHEFVELTQMRIHDYDYETAHIIANSRHNWSQKLDERG